MDWQVCIIASTYYSLSFFFASKSFNICISLACMFPYSRVNCCLAISVKSDVCPTASRIGLYTIAERESPEVFGLSAGTLSIKFATHPCLDNKYRLQIS